MLLAASASSSSSSKHKRSEMLSLGFWSTSEGIPAAVTVLVAGGGPGSWQFNAWRMRDSHLRAGPLSSAPSTFPAFKRTISWNLFATKCQCAGISTPIIQGEREEQQRRGGGKQAWRRSIPDDKDVGGRRRAHQPISQEELPMRGSPSHVPRPDEQPAEASHHHQTNIYIHTQTSNAFQSITLLKLCHSFRLQHRLMMSSNSKIFRLESSGFVRGFT